MAQIVMLVNTYKVKSDGTKTLLKQQLRMRELSHWERGATKVSDRQKVLDDAVERERAAAEKKYLEEGVHSWMIRAEIVQFQIILGSATA